MPCVIIILHIYEASIKCFFCSNEVRIIDMLMDGEYTRVIVCEFGSPIYCSFIMRNSLPWGWPCPSWTVKRNTDSKIPKIKALLRVYSLLEHSYPLFWQLILIRMVALINSLVGWDGQGRNCLNYFKSSYQLFKINCSHCKEEKTEI